MVFGRKKHTLDPSVNQMGSSAVGNKFTTLTHSTRPVIELEQIRPGALIVDLKERQAKGETFVTLVVFWHSGEESEFQGAGFKTLHDNNIQYSMDVHRLVPFGEPACNRWVQLNRSDQI